MINSTSSCPPDPYRRFPQEFPLHDRARQRFVFPEAFPRALGPDTTQRSSHSKSGSRRIADSKERRENEGVRRRYLLPSPNFQGNRMRAAQIVTMAKFRLPTIADYVTRIRTAAAATATTPGTTDLATLVPRGLVQVFVSARKNLYSRNLL